MEKVSQRAFTSASVRTKPLGSEQDIRQGSNKDKEIRLDVMIRGLWYRQFDAIIDIKLGDADADTYNYEAMIALLTRWEKIKKDKHDKHCHN